MIQSFFFTLQYYRYIDIEYILFIVITIIIIIQLDFNISIFLRRQGCVLLCQTPRNTKTTSDRLCFVVRTSLQNYNNNGYSKVTSRFEQIWLVWHSSRMLTRFGHAKQQTNPCQASGCGQGDFGETMNRATCQYKQSPVLSPCYRLQQTRKPCKPISHTQQIANLC